MQPEPKPQHTPLAHFRYELQVAPLGRPHVFCGLLVSVHWAELQHSALQVQTAPGAPKQAPGLQLPALHVSLQPQAPQFSAPSPHPLSMLPQFSPCAAQLVGVHPHTLATPPPAQVFGATQAPQLSEPPQPLGIEPQFLPCAAQLVGAQPQTLAGPPPPQVFGEVQLPQLSVPPQPLEIEPQFLPCAAQLVGVHPHTLAVPPPPQVFGAVQLPQSSDLPQPSLICPQFLPSPTQVLGTHAPVPQTLGLPLAPQV